MHGSCHSLDRLDVIFDDERSVANAGLMLAATLAQHLGLDELVDSCVDLGDAAGVPSVPMSGSSLYFNGPDGERLELIKDPLGEMYGSTVV